MYEYRRWVHAPFNLATLLLRAGSNGTGNLFRIRLNRFEFRLAARRRRRERLWFGVPHSALLFQFGESNGRRRNLVKHCPGASSVCQIIHETRCFLGVGKQLESDVPRRKAISWLNQACSGNHKHRRRATIRNLVTRLTPQPQPGFSVAACTRLPSAAVYKVHYFVICLFILNPGSLSAYPHSDKNT